MLDLTALVLVLVGFSSESVSWCRLLLSVSFISICVGVPDSSLLGCRLTLSCSLGVVMLLHYCSIFCL